MHLAYKNSTLSNIQKAYDALGSNDVEGPIPETPISDNIMIEEMTPKLPTVKQLKNYQLLDMSVNENEPFDDLETTLNETFGCIQDLESIFSNAINDSALPTTLTHDTWSVLKGMEDDAF